MTAAPLLSLRHYRHDLIAHSHDHSQLVFGLGGRLDFEVDGRGGRVGRQDLMVVPAGAHHTCGSPEDSHCLVLDVPGGHWLGEHLGEHADNSRRLLDRPGPLGLDSRQQQLVDWLAASPVDDPLIARQGAVLLLASLNPQVGAPGTGQQAPALCRLRPAYRAARRLSIAGRRSGAAGRAFQRATACAFCQRARYDADGLYP